MANPQIENGHIRIAHDLYRAAMRELTPTEFMVWAAIADETYGWNKKSAAISYNRIAIITGMHRTKAINYVARLKQRGVIWVQNRDDNSNIIGIVKDFERWLPGSQIATTLVAKQLLPTSSQTATTPSSQTATPLEPCTEPCTEPSKTDKHDNVPPNDKTVFVSSSLRTSERDEANSAILTDCWRKINEMWPLRFSSNDRETIRGLITVTHWRCVRDATKDAIAKPADNPIAYIKSESKRRFKELANAG